MRDSRNDIIRFILGAVSDGSPDVTDRELLARFTANQDQAAFELIVRRHGLMVWGVCCRTLHNNSDAEDALQATFLSLARQAGRIGAREESVGGWLYTVAHRTALKAKMLATVRRERERLTASPDEAVSPSAGQAAEGREIADILEQEVCRLPSKYRAPLVLHAFGDKKYEEIAQLLGISASLVGVRIKRAKDRLRQRLKRRGVVVGAGGAAVLPLANSGHAAVPGPLVVSTVKAAGALVAGEPLTGAAVSANVVRLAEAAARHGMRFKVAVCVGLLLVVGVGAATGTRWSVPPTPPSSGGRVGDPVDSPLQATNRAVGADPDSRQKKLREVVVPRLIAILEQLGGTASEQEAKVVRDNEEAEVKLSWKWLTKSMTIRLVYVFKTGEFRMWRDEGDGELRGVDPMEPIVWEVWRGGPKLLIGKSQAEQMQAAFQCLKD